MHLDLVRSLQDSATPISDQLGKRKDVQDFKRQVEKTGIMKKLVELVSRITDGVTGLNSLFVNYICAHMCDLMKHGQEIATITFPLPSFTAEEAAEMNKLLMPIIKSKSLVSNIKLLSTFNKLDEEKAAAMSNNMTAKELMPIPPDMLRPRILTPTEIELAKNACLTELNGHPALKVVEDFEEFCKLLARPENHVMIPSTQFIETQVNTYTSQEMTNQLAQELVNLPRYQAYTKLIDESGGKQIVRTHKTQTLPLADRQNSGNINRAINVAHMVGKQRDEIEAEIRERQSRWRPGPEPPSQTRRR